MNNNWRSHHWKTNGKPDGGQCYGINATQFTIAWQRGSIQEQGRNGAFLIEVLEACLEFCQNKAEVGFHDRAISSVTSGIGFTIAWQWGSPQQKRKSSVYPVLEACLDELQHKNTLFPCSENEQAIPLLIACVNSQYDKELVSHLVPCIDILKSRIQRREKQGIWGTHEPDPVQD